MGPYLPRMQSGNQFLHLLPLWLKNKVPTAEATMPVSVSQWVLSSGMRSGTASRIA